MRDDIQRIKPHAQQTDSDWNIFRDLATRLANEQKISPRVLFLEAHRKVTSSADDPNVLVRDNSARSILFCTCEFRLDFIQRIGCHRDQLHEVGSPKTVHVCVVDVVTITAAAVCV